MNIDLTQLDDIGQKSVEAIAAIRQHHADASARCRWYAQKWAEHVDNRLRGCGLL